MNLSNLRLPRLKEEALEIFNEKMISEYCNMMMSEYMHKPFLIPDSLGTLPKEDVLLSCFEHDTWFTEDNMQLIRSIVYVWTILNKTTFINSFMNRITQENNLKDIELLREVIQRLMCCTEKCDTDYMSEYPFFKDVISKIKLENGDMTLKITNVPKNIFIRRIGIEGEGIETTRNMYYQTVSTPMPYLTKGGQHFWTLSHMDMSIIEKAVEAAHGKVLVIGAKMGLFEYLAAKKDDVSSIRVLEPEKEVIKLYREFVIPNTQNGDKVKIEEMDIDATIEEAIKGDYDFIYAFDFRQSTKRYLKLRDLEKGCGVDVFYHDKDDIIESFKTRINFTVYKTLMGNKTNAPTNDIVDKRLENVTIKNIDDLRNLFNRQTIEEIF